MMLTNEEVTAKISPSIIKWTRIPQPNGGEIGIVDFKLEEENDENSRRNS